MRLYRRNITNVIPEAGLGSYVSMADTVEHNGRRYAAQMEGRYMVAIEDDHQWYETIAAANAAAADEIDVMVARLIAQANRLREEATA